LRGHSLFLAALLGFFATEFPDNATGTEFTVEAGIGAGFAEVKALLAIPQFMLLAVNARVPVRMKTAFLHALIIAKNRHFPQESRLNAGDLHAGCTPRLSAFQGVIGSVFLGKPSIPVFLQPDVRIRTVPH
jgi:hypothetical protein